VVDDFRHKIVSFCKIWSKIDKIGTFFGKNYRIL
jgi:hypothetical protein